MWVADLRYGNALSSVRRGEPPKGYSAFWNSGLEHRWDDCVTIMAGRVTMQRPEKKNPSASDAIGEHA